MLLDVEAHYSVAFFPYSFDPPQRGVSFVIKGSFVLSPNTSATPAKKSILPFGDLNFADDDSKSLSYPSDFAPRKSAVDLLLSATAVAPRNQPVAQLFTTWSIGKFSKSLRVTGERSWDSGFLRRQTSAPVPFLSLPITYENAFGGPGFTRNPVGCGYDTSPRVPPIEYPDRPVANPADRGEPAGFGPIAVAWEPRATLIRSGTYRGDWTKNRWPWFPKDFDWGFFNAAPKDQQVESLSGDEEIVFENMHPQHSVYRSRLPGVRTLCFLEERDTEGKLRFREVPLKLDTLWAEPHTEKLILVWRGNVPVRNYKLREVERLFVFSEPLSVPKKRVEQYWQQVLQQQAARAMAAVSAELAEVNAAAAEQIAGNAEYAAIEKEAEAEGAKAESLAAEEETKAVAEAAAMGVTLDLNKPEPATMLEGVRQARAEQAAAAAQSGPPPAGFPQPPAADFEWDELEADAAGADAEFAGMDKMTRAAVIFAAANGGDLSGMDLSELDLSGLSFRGLDLTRTVFKGADLTDADFTGTMLAGADLSTAKLIRAKLSEAVLDGADLTEADLTGAVVQGARFQSTTCVKAKLAKLDFSGCDCTRANFSDCDLTKARFVGSTLTSANFSNAILVDADFRKASMKTARLSDVKARGIILEEADVAGMHASGKGDFRGANLKNLQGYRSIWEGANLDQADLSRAILTEAQLSDTSLCEANLDRTNLAKAVFDDGVLVDTTVTNANLLKVSFDRAELKRTNLENTNVYDSGFFETVVEDVNLKRANLKNTRLRS